MGWSWGAAEQAGGTACTKVWEREHVSIRKELPVAPHKVGRTSTRVSLLHCQVQWVQRQVRLGETLSKGFMAFLCCDCPGQPGEAVDPAFKSIK